MRESGTRAGVPTGSRHVVRLAAVGVGLGVAVLLLTAASGVIATCAVGVL
ncbi:hypothetical protein QA811_29835 [Streptomyces sp. B21-102]